MPCRYAFQIKTLSLVIILFFFFWYTSLSKFFKVVKGEVKVFPESLGLDCLQLKIIHMQKWHILG